MKYKWALKRENLMFVYLMKVWEVSVAEKFSASTHKQMARMVRIGFETPK